MSQGTADVEWAQGMLEALFFKCGTWERVATEMAPHLSLTRAAWWKASLGQYVTPAKIAALRAYAGAPSLPPRTTRKRPERKSINVRRETWEILKLLKDPCETWDDMLLAIDLETQP